MEKRRRGRPRAYDPDLALESIVKVFWEKGFAGTSLDEIAAAAGMNRPSLYAAFGDKKSLYEKAMRRFMDDMRVMVGRTLSLDPLPVALKETFFEMIGRYTSGSEPRGCLVVCTAATEATADSDIRTELSMALEIIDGGFRARLERAQQSGELVREIDPALLAGHFGALIHSLAVRARAGQDPEQLRALADAFVDRMLASALSRPEGGDGQDGAPGR